MTIHHSFSSQFVFRPDLAFAMGMEREYFLTDATGRPVPAAEQVYAALPPALPGVGTFGYELSACQIETQSAPTTKVAELRWQQRQLETELDRVLRRYNLHRSMVEVAPADMPLTTYPDPDGRYQRLKAAMPPTVLSAACRVIGTHVHIGMPSAETALRIYNQVIAHSDVLCQMGDHSGGERMQLYQVVKPAYKPVPYESWADYEAFAKENGFHNDPRSCWHIIRLTIHGTIEFRNFGTCNNLDRIVAWAEHCRNLCLHYA
jgi:gamma-glutamyl:cysteine ligase YbdK (ATP-grasp superfamily)